MWRRLPAWAIAWLTVGGALVAVLYVPPARLPSDDIGLRVFRTPDISRDHVLTQTFEMPVDGFDGLAVAAASTGLVSGDVRFDLREDRLVYRAVVPAIDLVQSSWYRLRFAPIRDSGGQGYRLDVTGSEANPPSGVALLATKGERYPGGTMLFDDRERWADLAFRTFAPEGRSNWERLMSLPAGPRSYVILGALVAYWLLLGVVLRLLWHMRSEDSWIA